MLLCVTTGKKELAQVITDTLVDVAVCEKKNISTIIFVYKKNSDIISTTALSLSHSIVCAATLIGLFVGQTQQPVADCLNAVLDLV